MDNENFDLLIERYLNKETSSDENEQIENWLDENEPENTQWKSLSNAKRKAWLGNLYLEVIQKTESNSDLRTEPRKINVWRTVAAIAAILILALTLTLNWDVSRRKVAAADMKSVSIPQNQKKKVLLPDGSSVWINASSDLKFPESFKGNTREVYLTGEAYFDIKHNSGKPFIVHTGRIKTQVLGTAFNVNARGNSEKIIVTVTRGKVSVSDEDHLLAYVMPNQQLTYDLKVRKEYKTKVNAVESISWQGEQYFDNVTFGEAARQLEEHFKVRIDFSNQNIQNCRFSGTYLNSDDIDRVLRLICAFNKATYIKKENGDILIDGKGCN